MGMIVGNRLKMNKLEKRLELTEYTQGKFIDNFNKYQVEIQEYIDTNDATNDRDIDELEKALDELSGVIENITRERVIGKFSERDVYDGCGVH